MAPALAIPPVSSFAGIVGGEPAALGEFPYLVSLTRSNSHFCGGVLANANTVLTAGHCSVSQNAANVKVRAGTITWASGGTQVNVTTIIVNPTYNQGAATNNAVAVWHLAQPLLESDTIGYVTLPEQGSDPVPNSTTTTAGWGTLREGGSLSPNLQKVDVPVVSREICRSQYTQTSVTDGMFCAAYAEGGKDSCQGDSGGPIIDTASGVLLGLVSWGTGCARAGKPGVYSRVGLYVDWLKSNFKT